MQSGSGPADVAIVGAGIMGSSTAYHLAEWTDLDVVVLEREAVGMGSTGKSSGVIRFHYGDAQYYSEMAYRALDFWKNAGDRLGSDIGFTQNGYVLFGSEDVDYGEMDGYRVLREMGVEVELLAPTQFGDVLPHVEASSYDYAIHSPEAGFADPYAANVGFYRTAREAGVTFETGVVVTELHTDDGGDRVTGVATNEGDVEADHVVTAAGPWSRGLTATAGIDIPVTPSREQVLLIEPDDVFFDAYPYPFPTVTSRDPGHVYFRPEPVDKVLVGGHHRGETADPALYRESADMEFIDWAAGNLAERSPPLADAGLVRGYAGIYSNTPDKDFVIDNPVDGLVCLAGFSGHGFKHAPVVGEIAADLVVDGETDVVDLTPFSLDRFEEGADHRDTL
jgi:glycine/D-amino acid oxidase-like deaminating enzyme